MSNIADDHYWFPSFILISVMTLMCRPATYHLVFCKRSRPQSGSHPVCFSCKLCFVKMLCSPMLRPLPDISNVHLVPAKRFADQQHSRCTKRFAVTSDTHDCPILHAWHAEAINQANNTYSSWFLESCRTGTNTSEIISRDEAMCRGCRWCYSQSCLPTTGTLGCF